LGVGGRSGDVDGWYDDLLVSIDLNGVHLLACSHHGLGAGFCEGVGALPNSPPTMGTFSSQFIIGTPWSEIQTTTDVDVYTFVQVGVEAATKLRLELEDDDEEMAGKKKSLEKKKRRWGGVRWFQEQDEDVVHSQAGKVDRLVADMDLIGLAEETGRAISSIDGAVAREIGDITKLQRRLVHVLKTMTTSPISGRSGWARRLFDEWIGGGGSDRQTRGRRIDEVHKMVDQALTRRSGVIAQLSQRLPLDDFCKWQQEDGGPQATCASKRDVYTHEAFHARIEWKRCGRGQTDECRSDDVSWRSRLGGTHPINKAMLKMSEDKLKLSENKAVGDISGTLVARIKLLCDSCDGVASMASLVVAEARTEHECLETASQDLEHFKADMTSWGVMVADAIVREKEIEVGKSMEELLGCFGVERHGRWY
jgi:hypothetical protein